MIKKAIILLILPFVLFNLYSSDMKLYDDFDSEYIMVEKLTRLSGVIGPSTATPITSSELKLALDRVDRAILPARYKAEYDILMEKLSDNKDEFSFDGTIFLSPQVYLSIDQKTMNPDDYFIPFEHMTPAGYGEISFGFGPNFFIQASMEAINNIVIKDKPGIPYTSFDFILSNRADGGVFNVLSSDNPIQLFGEVPSMARGAIGNKWVNFVFGRTHHKMGSGYSGNMVVGDNWRFQEVAKLTAASNPFTYTMDFTHFDRQEDDKSIGKSRFSGSQVLRLIHRLDFNIMNKARIAANLGFLMYTDNIADMRLITPLFLVHNWYNFRENTTIESGDEANNIMSIEVDWVVMPSLKLGLQVVVDQWQMPWEKDSVPDAFGVLFNTSWLQTIKSGDIEYYIEGVYTAPNLYLNTKFNDSDKKQPNYNYDFSVGYFRRDTTGDIAWSGHQFGPNSLGIIIGAKTSLYDYNLEMESLLSYYAHGELGFDHDYLTEDIYDWFGTPEHRFDIKNTVVWNILPKLEIQGGLNFGFYWNFHHEHGVFKFMPQGMIGLKYTII